MSGHDDHDDLKPTIGTGYKIAEKKTVEELANLDANDESLARWKASLGLGVAHAPATGPKVTVYTLFLTSPTLPPGKKIEFNLQNKEHLKDIKVTIKEGVEYNVGICFKVNHSIVNGLHFIQVAKRTGITVDKIDQMLGSYGPSQTGEPYTKIFDPEESPSGMLARSGEYHVTSRVVDDDEEEYCCFKWKFKLAKEWDI